jgi:hypothetical protein
MKNMFTTTKERENTSLTSYSLLRYGQDRDVERCVYDVGRYVEMPEGEKRD